MCKEWFLIAHPKDDDETVKIDFVMSEKDIVRYSVFMQKHIEMGNETLDEAKDILGL